MTSSVENTQKWQSNWQDFKIYKRLRNSVSDASLPIFYLHESPYPLCSTPVSAFAHRLYQDIFLKYHLQKGQDVQFVPQWQQYSPYIEAEITKQLGKNTNGDRLASEYHKIRRFVVQNLADIRQKELKQLGMFADWEKGKKVTTQRDHAKVVTNFGRLVKSGCISQTQSLLYWCCRCTSVRHENEQLTNDSEVTSGYVCFPVQHGLERFGVRVDLAVWINELWQLVGCVAICLDPTESYFAFQQSGRCLILPKSLLSVDSFSSIAKADLMSVSVNEILDSRFIHPVSDEEIEIAVTTEKKVAKVSVLVPGHVKTDYRLAQEKNLPIPCILEENGQLVNDINQINQLWFEQADQQILADLNRRGANLNLHVRRVKKQHCFSCGQPTVYRPMKEWVWNPSKEHRNYFSNKSLLGDEITESPSLAISPLSISTHRYSCIPIPIFRCQKCGQDLCNTDALKIVRDLISRRGTNIWFSLEVEEMIPVGMSCATCQSSNFQKEFNFFDGRFANLLSQQIQLQNLDKEENLQLVYFYEQLKDVDPDLLSDNQLFFQQLFMTGLATHKRTLLDEVIFLGQYCETVSSTDFCPKMLSQYPPDVLRVALLVLLTSQTTLDCAIQQAQSDYQIVIEWLSAIFDCKSSQTLQEQQLSLLTAIDRSYEIGDFASVLKFLRDLVVSGTDFIHSVSIIAILQRIAPLMPFLAEQTYSVLKPLVNDSSYLNADSIFLTHWLDTIHD